MSLHILKCMGGKFLWPFSVTVTVLEWITRLCPHADPFVASRCGSRTATRQPTQTGRSSGRTATRQLLKTLSMTRTFKGRMNTTMKTMKATGTGEDTPVM